MAAPKAPVLGSQKTVTLEEGVFAVEVKPHLVHETVVAEQNAVRKHMKVFVNDESVRDLDEPVTDADELTIMQALSGGTQ